METYIRLSFHEKQLELC